MNTMNTATPETDNLRAFLEATEGKVLTRAQHEIFHGLYLLARMEQRARTLAN